MEPPAPPLDAPADLTPSAPRKPPLEERLVAFLEVVLCSDFPTQVGLTLLFARVGWGPRQADEAFQMRFVAPLLLTDTIVLVGLILLLLRSHGERARDVFLGHRDWRHELRAAVPMIFIAYGIALAVMLTVAAVAPWLHTVEQNPLQDLLREPRDAALFAFVVIVAGGVREEVQRAFILTRFERSLGGAAVGVAVSSVAFGVGHVVQGVDAAMATGVLGAFWAVSYLRRRSVVAPMVSHAAFDLLQIAIFVISGR